MTVERVAGVVTVVSAMVLSVAVGFFDWRVGMAVFGVLGLAAGVWTLTDRE